MRLFLFTSSAERAFEAQQAGIYSPVVDWERFGKYERQAGHDFEINGDTAEDAARLARRVSAPVTVRVNSLNARTEDEIEKALDAGAKVLMLPLAEDPSEVAAFLRLVRGRAKTLIQIETQRLVDRCDGLRDLPWDFAHIGLNDLRISRGSPWLWEPLYDGTVEQVCRTLAGRAVGFGGGTVVGGGDPIPFILLLKEMARLNCEMCILRRTYKSDMKGRDMGAEIDAFYATLKAAAARAPSAVKADHRALRRVLRRIRPDEAQSCKVAA